MQVLISMLVAAGASVSMGVWYRYRRKRAWRTLAGKRGLKVVGGGFSGMPELVGELDGYPIRVWVSEVEPNVQFTVVNAAQQTLRRPGFEQDLDALTGLLDEAVRRAIVDAEKA